MYQKPPLFPDINSKSSTSSTPIYENTNEAI